MQIWSCHSEAYRPSVVLLCPSSDFQKRGLYVCRGRRSFLLQLDTSLFSLLGIVYKCFYYDRAQKNYPMKCKLLNRAHRFPTTWPSLTLCPISDYVAQEYRLLVLIYSPYFTVQCPGSFILSTLNIILIFFLLCTHQKNSYSS